MEWASTGKQDFVMLAEQVFKLRAIHRGRQIAHHHPETRHVMHWDMNDASKYDWCILWLMHVRHIIITIISYWAFDSLLAISWSSKIWLILKLYKLVNSRFLVLTRNAGVKLSSDVLVWFLSLDVMNDYITKKRWFWDVLKLATVYLNRSNSGLWEEPNALPSLPSRRQTLH